MQLSNVGRDLAVRRLRQAPLAIPRLPGRRGAALQEPRRSELPRFLRQLSEMQCQMGFVHIQEHLGCYDELWLRSDDARERRCQADRPVLVLPVACD